VRVVFMGTPQFAVGILEALAGAHDVVAVYTRPDAVSGRGARTRPTPVKLFAEEHGIPVVQPRTLRDEAEQARLRVFDADIIVVAAYGLILPLAVLGAAPLGAVNVHGSLLPRWRGAAPVQRAILAGDRETGVAIMRMEEGLDTGPFCLTAHTETDDKSAIELTEELSTLGAGLLLEALDAIEAGTCHWVAQDDSLATYADKVTRDDVAIDPAMTALDAARRVRASSAQAGTRVVIAGRGATVIRAHASAEGAGAAGSVTLSQHGIVLGLSDGGLEIDVVKPDGKHEMNALDWARGLRLTADAEWTSAT